jgi:Mg2+ transporter MgtE
LPSGVIPWEDVAPLQHDEPLRLQVSRDKITRLPPADIATILNDLDRHTSEALATTLSDEALADTLEESPMDMQVSVLSHLPPERAADILEEMDPDEAADLLAGLSDQTSAELLNLMEDEDAEDVQDLLRYPVDSAGGIMTTEFVHVPHQLTAGQALDYLRGSREAKEDEVMPYIYLTDENGRLYGIISLRDLVMASQDVPLDEWSEKEPLTVTPYTSQEEVAYLVAKYDLLAVPVVDEESDKLLGIVTVDDAIDAVLPTAWKKRIPRFF